MASQKQIMDGGKGTEGGKSIYGGHGILTCEAVFGC